MPKDDEAKTEAKAEAKVEAKVEPKWEPPLENKPAGIVEAATDGVKDALKIHDDAIRTAQQMQREAEPPKCIIAVDGGVWSWRYHDQSGTASSKAEVLEHARTNLKPLLDGNDEPLNVVYEVV